MKVSLVSITICVQYHILSSP